MNRFRFAFLDKTRKEVFLPALFDILYHNMSKIAPSGLPYGEERESWLSEVGPAMDKAPRQIILMYAGEGLAGYFQYYVNGGTFMVEEIQITPEYQGTTLLYALFRFLGTVLPGDIKTIAAYAHKSNLRSQAIMKKLGMEQARENEDGFCYYTGDFSPVDERFRRR